MGFFYNLQVRYHLKNARVLADRHDIRQAADLFADSLAQGMGLSAKETAVFFMINFVRNTISPEKLEEVTPVIIEYAAHVGVDWDTINKLDLSFREHDPAMLPTKTDPGATTAEGGESRPVKKFIITVGICAGIGFAYGFIERSIQAMINPMIHPIAVALGTGTALALDGLVIGIVIGAIRYWRDKRRHAQ
jgi:hypothetical protein